MRTIQYSRDGSDGIDRPQRTGYPAFAGYDGFGYFAFARRSLAVTAQLFEIRIRYP